MEHSVTIEDVIRMTAESIRDICAMPVQLNEDVRYRLAMNYRTKRGRSGNRSSTCLPVSGSLTSTVSG